MPLPLYGFTQGDTIGLLMVVDEKETVQGLADKLQEAASIRVRPKSNVQVLYKDRAVDPKMTLEQAGFAALERFDVVPKEE